MEISLNINNRKYTLQVQNNWTLLYVLRDVLRLTGTKYGCGTGDCGACKVLIDGDARNSCTILAKNVNGSNITTIEGVSKGAKLHPIQEAFVEAGAIQCGYCTPGMVITSLAFLNKNTNPSEEEIADALDNNLCRCTGYKNIVDAIKLASEKISQGGEN
jgi:carbon-monoxide dehydrogenase small subunit